MIRTLTRIAIAATLLGSASAAMAAPRHSVNENGFQAVYRANQADAQRTSGFTGPSSGSNTQVDRTGALEE